MIRFCDREVNCVTLKELSRSILFSYFLNGSREDILCVINENGQYDGMITYNSLLNCSNIQTSILKEKLVLDNYIWENGRKLFLNNKEYNDENALVPVVNREGYLLCFAFQDKDANREIRQLRELNKCSYALNFQDVFSEYDCVTIWGINELAYSFAQYLKALGVTVHVKGEFWKELGNWGDYECLGCRNLDIYAEGTWYKKENMWEVVQRSVSVEFECVDNIYEANIEKGYIVDADINLRDFLSNLKSVNELYLLGTDILVQDTYDFLVKNGIDIKGFISDNEDEMGHIILGKPVYSRYNIEKNDQTVIIECTQKHSAWGFGLVDFFDYAGYYRNEKFFLIKDYCDGIIRNQLKHVLYGKRLVLAGDFLLCKMLYSIMIEIADCSYWNVMNDKNIIEDNEIVFSGEVTIDKICLLVLPEYFVHGSCSEEAGRKKRNLIERITELGIVNYTDYFCHTINLIELQEKVSGEKSLNYPKGICIGAIQYFCGNIFFRGVLEGHPQIIMMDSCYLSDNIFSICLRLATRKSEEICYFFWKIIENELNAISIKMEDEFPDRKRFDEILQNEMKKKKKFTSKELFIILHLAYVAMWNKVPSNLTDMIIYWEPHFITRDVCELFAKWLNIKKASGYLINMVRNGVIRCGSYLKLGDQGGRINELRMGHYWNMIDVLEPRRECYDGYKRVVIKFEELKCEPIKILKHLCRIFDIVWSDTFLKTTAHGKIIEWRGTSGFDLRPVYDNFEKYFSEYDRMRLSLLLYDWQYEYGYPVTEILEFTRKELQEMFIRDFRFEKFYEFWNEADLWKYKVQKMNWMRIHIQQIIFLKKCTKREDL